MDETKARLERLRKALPEVAKLAHRHLAQLDVSAFRSSEPLPFEDREHGRSCALKSGDAWAGLFECAWFHFTGMVPDEARGKAVVLILDVGGEMAVVDKRGVPVRGLSALPAASPQRLGRGPKRVLPFLELAQGGERVDLWADAGANDISGDPLANGIFSHAEIATVDPEARALFYDLDSLLATALAGALPESELSPFLDTLEEASETALSPARGGVTLARAKLAPLLAAAGESSLCVSAVGHAHLDLAWLWPIRETIRKGARTFATALSLMERDASYVFGASQPQLFSWMKRDYPELYEKIRARVLEGRLEAQGALWVEPDPNITGGESLVRQLLYGKRFFRAEFGLDLDYVWLPDSFGYNAAMPQIFARGGVRYFMTQKLSWSRFNTFPHHSFHWEGIDGSRVLTHMLPEDNYLSRADPRAVHKIDEHYRQRDVSNHALMLFGLGDGGGGPGPEHLERVSRIRNRAFLPRVVQRRAGQFFEDWASEAEGFPVWRGELYLERHQGTFTTHGNVKRANRQLEQSLRDWEWSAALAAQLCGLAYPAQHLSQIWQETLLYQFHDILPGSSVKRVYDECLPRYEALLEETRRGNEEAEARLAVEVDTRGATSPYVVRNNLGWTRQEWIELPTGWHFASVPGMGHAVLDGNAEASTCAELEARPDRLENDLLSLQFNDDGSIASIFDKALEREIVAADSRANQLLVYRDDGDAWDSPPDYRDTVPRTMELVSSEARKDGPRAVLLQRYRLGHSQLEQEISLCAGSRRIEFRTRGHWRETACMLRTRFPLAVRSEFSTSEIQFGFVRRPTHDNTSWDWAKDEIPAQRWIDLSQRDYGVGLLNDCKYGHRSKGNELELNLLRSAPYPGPKLVADQDVAPGEPHHGFSDQCDHEFAYALFPHPGDAVEGGVLREAAAFNHPLRITATDTHAGSVPARYCGLELDAPNVVIEAVKQAEDDDALIVRLYEAEERTTRTGLRVGFELSAAFETNLLEEVEKPLEIADGWIALELGPFEIKTLRLLAAPQRHDAR